MRKFILYLLVIFSVILVGCSQKETIGPLGSAHTHADFKVYILGNPINFDGQKYQVRDQIVHVENFDGEVVHIHATGITLGYFFKTLGLELDDKCITLDTGNKYCNSEEATLKAFVKGPGFEWETLYSPADYVINDLDRILISYGAENAEEIKTQQESVTEKSIG